MNLDGFSGELGDCDAASLGLVTKLGINVLRKLYRRSVHDMPAYRDAAFHGEGDRQSTWQQKAKKNRCSRTDSS